MSHLEVFNFEILTSKTHFEISQLWRFSLSLLEVLKFQLSDFSLSQFEVSILEYDSSTLRFLTSKVIFGSFRFLSLSRRRPSLRVAGQATDVFSLAAAFIHAERGRQPITAVVLSVLSRSANHSPAWKSLCWFHVSFHCWIGSATATAILNGNCVDCGWLSRHEIALLSCCWHNAGNTELTSSVSAYFCLTLNRTIMMMKDGLLSVYFTLYLLN